MTVVRTDIAIDAIALLKGAHSGPEDGGCIMEWAAYLAGEPWSDHLQQSACELLDRMCAVGPTT